MYAIDKVIDEDMLEDLYFEIEGANSVLATIQSKGNRITNPKIRSTSIVPSIKASDWPDICKNIMDMAKKADILVDRNKLMLHEFNLLIYNPGDHFVKHKDRIGSVERKRFYSTSTIIYKSPDLEGGELLLWDDNGKPEKIDLNVGETILFASSRLHQVDPVKRGKRIVLVAWIIREDAN